jgi:AcrR family transcriptional regulator
MEEAGVGGLSMSEIARLLGMRQPSLHKYFPSLHAVYDACLV